MIGTVGLLSLSQSEFLQKSRENNQSHLLPPSMLLIETRSHILDSSRSWISKTWPSLGFARLGQLKLVNQWINTSHELSCLYFSAFPALFGHNVKTDGASFVWEVRASVKASDQWASTWFGSSNFQVRTFAMEVVPWRKGWLKSGALLRQLLFSTDPQASAMTELMTQRFQKMWVWVFWIFFATNMTAFFGQRTCAYLTWFLSSKPSEVIPDWCGSLAELVTMMLGLEFDARVPYDFCDSLFLWTLYSLGVLPSHFQWVYYRWQSFNGSISFRFAPLVFMHVAYTHIFFIFCFGMLWRQTLMCGPCGFDWHRTCTTDSGYTDVATPRPSVPMTIASLSSHQFPALSRNQQFHGIATSALRVLSSNRAWQLQSSGIGLDEDVLGIPTSCPSQLAPCRKLPGNPFVCFFCFLEQLLNRQVSFFKHLRYLNYLLLCCIAAVVLKNK